MWSNVIDYTHREANMYGCQPRPKCGSRYRVPYCNPDGSIRIDCDKCGFSEPAKESVWNG